MARIGEGGDLLKCSFCGKSQKQVKKLIAGPAVYICDECIDLCNEIIRDELPGLEAAKDKENGSDLPTPAEIKAKIAETIATGAVKKSRPMVGAQFLKFCGKYELNRLSENSTQFAEFLSAEYS